MTTAELRALFLRLNEVKLLPRTREWVRRAEADCRKYGAACFTVNDIERLKGLARADK